MPTTSTDTQVNTQGRERVLSGIQPTADSYHLGNYLGALRQWVNLQDDFDALYFVPNLHAITVRQDPAELRERTLRGAAQLIALGIDPARSTLFVQSQVPEHLELSWVLTCLTGFGEAGRMTQFKDKSAKQGSDHTSVGLFAYPILMAADILLYRPQRVPVGEDQRQHLELTRTLAERFNSRYGQTFTVPEAHIAKEVAKIYDLQDPSAKMSKSTSNPKGIINILDDVAASAKKLRSAVTDTENEVRFDPAHKPGVSNLLTINAALSQRSVAEAEAEYAGGGYGDLKQATAQIFADFARPVHARFAELMEDRGELTRILDAGALRAREIASGVVDEVYEKLGLVRPSGFGTPVG